MKSVITLLLICLGLVSRADYWTQKANFPDHVSAATGFVINGFGYIGLGDNPFPATLFYKYDTLSNTWSYSSLFPSRLIRSNAFGFSINGFGYVGCGVDSNGQASKSFWEYDPTANTWTQKADYGGGKRFDVACFVINGKGYVGTGFDSAHARNDFWEYTPLTNQWIQKASFGGVPRWGASAFAIGTKGYMGIGADSNQIYLLDFWEYDPVIDVWTQLNNFGGGPRNRATSFVLNDFGYIGTGTNSVNQLNDYWKYNPINDSWTQVASMVTIRQLGVAFAIGTHGYVGTGADIGSPYYNDFWEYTPDTITGIIEHSPSKFTFKIAPNPAHDDTFISFIANTNEYYDLKVMNVTCDKVYLTKLYNINSSFKLPISNLKAGTYIVEISNQKYRAYNLLIKE